MNLELRGVHDPRLSTLLTFAVAVGLGAWMTTSARAQLQYYEGFDYPGSVGATVSGLNGGSGTWQAAWTTGSGAFLGTNIAGGLTYMDGTGHQLATDPDSIKLAVGVPPPNPTSTTASPNRTMLGAATTYTNLGAMAAANPNGAGVVWMSFLFQRPTQVPGATGFFRQANFGLFQGTAEKLDVGDPNTSATVLNNISLWSSGGTDPAATPLQSSVSGFSDSGAQLIVLKLTLDTFNATTPTKDGASVWINPNDITSLAASPDINQASEVDISGVTVIRFQAGNFNGNGTNAFFYADEVRVGFSASDVLPLATPEPSSVALVAVGGTALFFWRRRSRS
jgi:hypothetical protein